MRLLLLLMLSFTLSACYWGMDDYSPTPRYAKSDLWVSNFKDGNFPGTAYINDKIYCSSMERASDSSNLFYCFGLKTGKLDWAVEVVRWYLTRERSFTGTTWII
ncbi:hypothetical protein [Paraflavitalea speifideaquila]|uniref:hypothetical protein n=1 Tax=Paraflavitalea speifideaquila TaxID=3076558 RepID=UPI0028E86006|nr:hypothetical protein [Paraflavitalea speifideiaquila]